MEDDDETHSRSSPGREPHSPPHHNTLTLTLPIQHPSSRPPRDECWSVEATAALMEAWGEKYLELNRGNLRQTHWQEVASAVNRRSNGAVKSDVQCKHRIDTLKKKYKLELAKVGPSSWPFFHSLHRLLAPSSTPSAAFTVPSSLHHLQTPPHLRKHNHIPSPVLTKQEEEEEEEDSGESLQPKRKRVRGGWVRELTEAVVEFREAYEAAESAKLEQMMEMEKQRMKFVKELELQRIKFMINTQLALSQLCNSNGGNGNHESGGDGGKEISNHRRHHHGNHVDHDS